MKKKGVNKYYQVAFLLLSQPFPEHRPKGESTQLVVGRLELVVRLIVGNRGMKEKGREGRLGIFAGVSTVRRINTSATTLELDAHMLTSTRVAFGLMT